MKRRSKRGAKALKRQRRKTATPPRLKRAKAAAPRRRSTVTGREAETARLTRELNETREQQTATAEILQVISGSLADLKPVFEAVLANATRLCEANFGILQLRENGDFRNVAMHNPPPALAEYRSREPVIRAGPQSAIGRVAATKRFLHIADYAAEPAYKQRDPAAVNMVERAGARTLLLVPMLKDGEHVGNLNIYRREVRPFTDRQIALVQSFAAQAVIAIENARLLNEQREALQRQTATADVLRIISTSPGDLQPVFEAILANALRICEAKFGHILLYDGERFHASHLHDVPPSYRRFWEQHGPIRPGPNTGLARLARTKQIAHIPDLKADPAYAEREPLRVVTVDEAGARSLLAAPMVKEDQLIGAIVIYRQEVQPFTDRQIELVKNFAAQAVIAVENARLLNELRQRTTDLTESLEQQTASADVLRIISSSPGELNPVFDAILKNATHICDANFGVLFLCEGDAYRAVAMHNAPPAYVEARRREPLVSLSGTTVIAQVARAKRTIQTADATKEPAYQQNPQSTQLFVNLTGARSFVAVPMLKGSDLIGAIVIYRQEVRPFTDKQIELVESFAAQAVIAIENARLLGELRQRTTDLTESLEQQTASADVLRIISSSPGELNPVFDTILQNAARICEAKFGILMLRDGEGFRSVAIDGAPHAYTEAMAQNSYIPPRPGSGLVALVETKQPVQLQDLQNVPAYAGNRLTTLAGARTLLIVPLLKDDRLIGAINIYRQEVRPFTVKQVALLENFAAQAVIAIENARLLSELRQRTTDLTESLEQQTATSEVLRVISGSPGDLGPVFRAMMENATQICGADFGSLSLYEGDYTFRVVAVHGAEQDYAEQRKREPVIRRGPGTMFGDVVESKKPVHITDLAARPELAPTLAKLGCRTLMIVPMLKDGEFIGTINIFRYFVQPFSEKQIALVQNFSAQAVIAIENTRLLNELRESLEQQTASANVLRIISSSQGELEPVFQAVLENATRICEAKFGNIYRWDGESLHLIAVHDTPAAFAEFRRNTPFRPNANIPTGRMVATKAITHVADLAAEPGYAERDQQFVAGVELGGIRTLLSVPMLRDDRLIGAFTIYRDEVRPFTDRQITLAQNFANQAVIAIENARLLNELRQRTDDLSESLEQQTATSEVLSVISKSRGDLQPVFEAMLDNAVRICGAKFGTLFRFDGEKFHTSAFVGAPQEYVDYQAKRGPFVPPHGAPLDLVLKTRDVVRTLDMSERPARATEFAQYAGTKSHIAVPMLRDEELVGAIVIYNLKIQPFTDKQIALVQNFAAQAVIAIENARLLNELRESLQQQTATADVLKVISRSTFDLQTVLQTLVESAAHLSGADKAQILRPSDNQHFYAAASFGHTREYDEYLSTLTFPPGREGVVGRVLLERGPVQIADVLADPDYRLLETQRLGGFRTHLGVPLLREGNPVGVLVVSRVTVRPFDEKQIELLTTFADQAVIAIENVRLFEAEQQRTRELSETLDRQTATAEVLRVISSSPGDLKPVFQAMLDNATRLCEAKFGHLYLWDGAAFNLVAMLNTPPALAEERLRSPLRPGASEPLGRMLATKSVVHVSDASAEQAYIERSDPALITAVELGGIRTLAAVPMLKDSELLGALTIYRQDVRPFSDRQIELVSNFADQAVIAIENTRLLSELRESLQQQTATADVLKVISRSTFDLQVVLDTLVESASRLCEAEKASMNLARSGGYQAIAMCGFSEEFRHFARDYVIPAGKGSVVGRVVVAGTPVQIPDVTADPDYKMPEIVDFGRVRTLLGVPMLREGNPTGVIVLMRSEVRPFTAKHIELAQTFADQAAIAIENVRLFEAEQERTRELAKSLDDLRTAQDRLVQTQKLASLGQLTAGIAHEIKNPLNFVNNFSGISVELIDELRETVTRGAIDGPARAEVAELADTLRDNLNKIAEHGKRADSIVKNMLLHSREGSGEHRPVDVNALVDESLNLAYHGARAEKQGFTIALERSFDPAVGEADVYPQEITRVLLNVIANGFYAATQRKTQTDGDGYEPTLTASTRNLGDRVAISIRDNGTGIPPDVKEQMFNPFFTTKPTGEGTGLGLSISHDIVVKQHAGTIEVDTCPGEYTEIIVVLPRTAG
jgi:two-component system, NtrC family, sensor kinase